MRRIKVKTSREYSALVGSGAVENISCELKELLKAKKIMVVSDDNVAHLHLEKLLNRL